MTEQTPPEGFVPDRRELTAEALADLKRHFRAKIQADQVMTAAPEPMAECPFSIDDAVHDLRKALHCLYLATDSSVASDVQKRAERVIGAFEAALTASTASAELEKLRERCAGYKGQIEAGAAKIEELKAALASAVEREREECAVIADDIRRGQARKISVAAMVCCDEIAARIRARQPATGVKG